MTCHDFDGGRQEQICHSILVKKVAILSPIIILASFCCHIPILSTRKGKRKFNVMAVSRDKYARKPYVQRQKNRFKGPNQENIKHPSGICKFRAQNQNRYLTIRYLHRGCFIKTNIVPFCTYKIVIIKPWSSRKKESK